MRMKKWATSASELELSAWAFEIKQAVKSAEVAAESAETQRTTEVGRAGMQSSG